MHWKLKALIQRVISRLPSDLSYSAYYWMQRRFGGLGELNPDHGLFVGFETWKRLIRHGRDPRGRVFFEVGTGRAPIVPLAFYLMGAEKTVSVDLNPYFREELLLDALDRLARDPDQLRRRLEPYLVESRLAELLRYCASGGRQADSFFELCRIEYMAPCDASSTGLQSGSIDYHTSNTTLEHIPESALVEILREGGRLIGPDGLLIHRIDYSDHFSHSDKRISPVNFLRFSDAAWDRYANNRYMYMNRLRHDDLLEIFERDGREIVESEPDINQAVLADIQGGRVRIDRKFSAKAVETLATTGAWIVARLESPRRGGVLDGPDTDSAEHVTHPLQVDEKSKDLQ